jgi:hypothetical protein
LVAIQKSVSEYNQYRRLESHIMLI